MKRLTLPSLAALGLACFAAGAFSGCNAGKSCVSTREYFANEILGGAMKQCAGCHEPGGLASEKGAEFILLPATYPGFLDANMDAVREMAKNQYDGTPLLLAKPSALTEHGGGKVIDEGDENYEKISDLIAQLDSPVECPTDDFEADYEGVQFLDEAETLRKAALHLVGRLPSQDELNRVTEGGDEALAIVLEEMMTEDAFYERLTEMWGDLLLTDRYLAYTGFAVNLLDPAAVPNAGAWYANLGDEDSYLVNRAVAQEPLDLINYIVRNDRPFTEILTADYTVFNSYSAGLYQPDGVSFGGPDYTTFKEGKIKMLGEGGQALNIPHAGILTSPMFLNRFPTTPTNRNRHRARMVLKLFLATDILKIAERPIDPSAPTEYNNPTRDNPSCSVCHNIIDPLAGGFQKYDDNDQEEYIPDREWYTDMVSPGYGDETMPTSEYHQALPWLAQRAADDPRFVLGTIYNTYTALTGLAPLDYPTDAESPTYAAELDAWQAQDALFTKIGEEFVMADYNLKTVISGIVRSPYFRAANAEEPLTDELLAKYVALGGGRLSTPERLARKIEAVTGVHWVRPWDLADYLLTEYRILYGGIDADTITNRLTQMNGLMAGVSIRMANEVACGTTAYDFSRAIDQRKLFPHVTLDHLPEGASGQEVPDAIEDIKTNIVYLHERVLGEKLEISDPEIERTYQVFYETWKEGMGIIAGDPGATYLTWQCQARVDPTTQVDLPESEQISQDPNYTVRAWMAVMTYLLSDYKFLYE